MAATYDDRLNGITTSVCVKAPCVARTTANITLSGTQTIDGVAVVADDRVLVVAQTTASENGIWVCQSSAWARADDFDGAGDVVKGTLITVLGGSTLGSNIIWKVTAANPITIGTTNITIQALALASPASYGTMADQDATAVNIDGGAIDGTTIGANSAAAVTGTVFTGNRFVPNNSTIPTDGLYLPSANNVGLSARSLLALNITNPASAVNYWALSGSATTDKLSLTATGTDTNIGLNFVAKGNSQIHFTSNAGIQFKIAANASVVNCLQVVGTATTGSPTLAAVGSDTNIDLTLTPQGTGVLQFGTAGCFIANGSATVTISALAPAGVTTATIKKWLTVKDSAGTVLYIPAWGA